MTHIAESSSIPSSTTQPLDGVIRLTHLGVIRIEGEDAAKFIHGQLTQDFALLGQNEARLSAFCSAKGRMQASFIGFKRSNGDILLVCSRDILANTLKRLSQFVMRAKARLSDATAEFAIYGLAGNAIKNIADHAYSAWAKADFDASSVITLYPAMGVPRQLMVTLVGATAPSGSALGDDMWQWGEVHSGVATITAPLVELFVPQMLNFESIGGVNFKKGCYPGQEIVARSQFRGTLKRRAFLVHADSAMDCGAEIFGPVADGEPVGTVVQAAISPAGGFDAIISAQLSAMDAGLFLGSTAGPALTVLPLPYPLLDDI